MPENRFSVADQLAAGRNLAKFLTEAEPGAYVAGHFTCEEAEFIAEQLFAMTGEEMVKHQFLYMHSDGDDGPDDLHRDYPQPSDDFKWNR
jgi:hypothetical protein